VNTPRSVRPSVPLRFFRGADAATFGHSIVFETLCPRHSGVSQSGVSQFARFEC
jgi:hypothetical protein